MVAREILRRYSFFVGLSLEQLDVLANAAEEITVEAEHHFFREGEALDNLYLVREGAVKIVFEVPARNTEPKLAEQFSRQFQTKDIVISTVGPGEVFGWSGLVPPHKATASAKAMTPALVVVFDCRKLRAAFEEDCRFGYLLMQKAAQVIRERLHDLRIESLAYIYE